MFYIKVSYVIIIINVSINNTLQKLILQQIIINKLLKIVEKFLFRQFVRKKLLKKHS